MQLSDFTYDLPEELIAHFPVARRSESRLLCLDASSGSVQHRIFKNLVDYLQAGDLLIFNDTRVIPARLFAYKDTGGKLEVLIERVLGGNQVLAQIRSSKSPKPGAQIVFEVKSSRANEGQSSESGNIRVDVISRDEGFYYLQFPTGLDLMELLDQIGHMPLPPYIKRGDQEIDTERYQTIYASNAGAVAAPTAGLHFDEDLMRAIKDKNVDLGYLTLHVGAGTFQPVRVDNIKEHKMHTELIDVGPELVEQVAECRARGGRVIAVGTTTVRSLETAARTGVLESYQGETDIFIYPGYEFNVVDAMITNFHLPESTLLMLVSAFCSKEMLLDAYEEAVEQKYRFFSYGDAMFVFYSGGRGIRVTASSGN